MGECEMTGNDAFEVLETPGEGLSAVLHDWLRRHLMPRPNGKLLLLSPEVRPDWGHVMRQTCTLLLLPGGVRPPGGFGRGTCVVSYGSGSRDSITLSSIEPDRLSAAIQREIPTLSGEMLEEQEIILPASAAVSPLRTLAAAGGLLLLGAAPRMLMEEPPFFRAEEKRCGK